MPCDYNTVFSAQQKPFVAVLMKTKGLQVTGDMRHMTQFVRYDRMLFSAFFIQNPIRPQVRDLCHVTYNTVFSAQQKPFAVVLMKKKGLQVTGDMRHMTQFVRYDRMLFSAFFTQIRPHLHDL